MSEFTELSRAAYEAISRDDLEGFVALADPDVEFNSLIEGRSYRGHEGVREWWNNVIRSLGGVSLDLEEVFDLDDHGYVKMVATGTVGGVDVPQEIWQAIRIEDGKAVWWGIFRSEDEARQALGVGDEGEPGS
jgi:ketosteroid isomerase-like protein